MRAHRRENAACVHATPRRDRRIGCDAHLPCVNVRATPRTWLESPRPASTGPSSSTIRPPHRSLRIVRFTADWAASIVGRRHHSIRRRKDFPAAMTAGDGHRRRHSVAAESRRAASARVGGAGRMRSVSFGRNPRGLPLDPRPKAPSRSGHRPQPRGVERAFPVGQHDSRPREHVVHVENRTSGRCGAAGFLGDVCRRIRWQTCCDGKDRAR